MREELELCGLKSPEDVCTQPPTRALCFLSLSFVILAEKLGHDDLATSRKGR